MENLPSVLKVVSGRAGIHTPALHGDRRESTSGVTEADVPGGLSEERRRGVSRHWALL